MATITTTEANGFIAVTVTADGPAERNLGQKAAGAARKAADGRKVSRLTSETSTADGVETRIAVYAVGPTKAEIAAEKAAKAEVKYHLQVRAEYEREWEKVNAAEVEGAILSTAQHCMLSGDENADLTASEEGFERHSDRWYVIALSSYESLMDELQPEHRALAYTRNIDADILNGVLEAL